MISLLLASALASVAQSDATNAMRADSGESRQVSPSAKAAEPAVEAELLNVGELITGEDYPAEAIERGEEGVVTVKVLVSQDGRIGDCVVAESSGSAPLDAQTCRLFWLRARFKAALDAAGKPIASEIRQKIRWALAGEVPQAPFEAWTVRTVVTYDSSGAPVSCDSEAIGPMEGRDFCDFVKQMETAFSAERSRLKLPVGSVVFETRFAPGEEMGDQPSTLPNHVLLLRQVSRVGIDQSGKILDCSAVRVEGLMEPATDACDSLRRERFVPAPTSASGAPERTGTVTMSVYVGEQPVASNARRAGPNRA